MRFGQQVLRFLAVGLVATGIHYAVLLSAVEMLGWNAVLASSTGFVVSALANYALNRRYTFPTDVPHGIAMLRFTAVMAVAAALNALCMQLMNGILHWHYVVAQVLTTGVVMGWNFLAHRIWTFRGSAVRRAA